MNQDHCQEFFEEKFEIVILQILLSVHLGEQWGKMILGDGDPARG